MAAERGRHVKLVGLDVKDEAIYRRYREGMTPLLHRHQGAFGYDFVVSQVLKSETVNPINRVFTMIFPDEATAGRFFSDPEYLEVRRQFFERAAGSVTKIGDYTEART